MYRIPLFVEGVNLEDEEVLAKIGQTLPTLGWTQVGDRVVAVLHTADVGNPAGPVVQVARQLENAIAGARVCEVDLDLVSVSDIAHRAGVNRETVRLWADGRRGPGSFPPPAGVPGSSRVWRWARVSEWLETNYDLSDGDEKYLSDEQVAKVNCALLKSTEHIDSEWEAVSATPGWITTASKEIAHQRTRAEPVEVLSEWLLAISIVEPHELNTELRRAAGRLYRRSSRHSETPQAEHQ